MDDQRTRFVSRSPGMASSSSGGGGGSGSGGGATASLQGTRSQWHGMDLHTSTPSSHRRAMHISSTQPATPTAAAPTAAAADASRARADAAALSARNQVLHRKLSERKRFDSADYAMKMVRQAMQSSADDPPERETPTDLSTALQSPRLSPTHGRMVFAHALKRDDGDVEMKDDSVNNQEPSPAAPSQRTYGGLNNASGMTASAALSARSILIQKKLHEKRHFDSADYQLALQGMATDAAMDGMGKPALDRRALPFTRTPSPMQLNPEVATASPVNSPSAARAAVFRNNQMSPSVRASTGGGFGGGRSDAGKYGSLGGGPSAAKGTDLRRSMLLRQQEDFMARTAASPNAPAEASAAQQTSPAVEQPQASAPSKYGRVVAANILLRKHLKDRQRFDSADYQMEAAAKLAHRASGKDSSSGDNQTGDSSPVVPKSRSNQDEEISSPVMKPQAKHIKLTQDAAPGGGWASHPAVSAARQTQSQPTATRGGWGAHPAVSAARDGQTRTVVSDGGKLAAANVLISRKLDEGKKMFDSADHFSAKDLAAKAAANRRRQEAARGAPQH